MMNFYLKSFLIFFRIGVFTIGGGYAMVPIIEAELVDKRKWISKEDFLDLLALAQTVPGIFAVNISIFIGYKLRKFWGGRTGLQRHPSCCSGPDCGTYLQDGQIGPDQPLQHLDSGRFGPAYLAHRLLAHLRHHSERCGRILLRPLQVQKTF